VVWTVHNALPHDRQRLDRALRWLLVRCARLVVHAEATRAAVPRARRPAAVVPHGHYIGWYPDDLSPAEARRALGLEPADAIFVCFGQLRAYKGIDGLLTAFAGLPDPGLRLVIAGRPASERDAAVVRAGAGDPRVRTHLGFVPDADVQRFLKAADFVVLPYRDVLTSGAALLALSFGRPVVVPRLGCLVELEREGCALAYDPDAGGGLRDALAAAAQIAAEPARLADWQERAAAAARARDWNAIAAAYARIYRGD
jgi:glycosyltransferase involved in cell wall biosynthesis